MTIENNIKRARNAPSNLSDVEVYTFLVENGMANEDAYLSIVCANLLEKYRQDDIDSKFKELEELEKAIL